MPIIDDIARQFGLSPSQVLNLKASLDAKRGVGSNPARVGPLPQAPAPPGAFGRFGTGLATGGLGLLAANLAPEAIAQSGLLLPGGAPNPDAATAEDRLGDPLVRALDFAGLNRPQSIFGVTPLDQQAEQQPSEEQSILFQAFMNSNQADPESNMTLEDSLFFEEFKAIADAQGPVQLGDTIGVEPEERGLRSGSSGTAGTAGTAGLPSTGMGGGAFEALLDQTLGLGRFSSGEADEALVALRKGNEAALETFGEGRPEPPEFDKNAKLFALFSGAARGSSRFGRDATVGQILAGAGAGGSGAVRREVQDQQALIERHKTELSQFQQKRATLETSIGANEARTVLAIERLKQQEYTTRSYNRFQMLRLQQPRLATLGQGRYVVMTPQVGGPPIIKEYNAGGSASDRMTQLAILDAVGGFNALDTEVNRPGGDPDEINPALGPEFSVATRFAVDGMGSAEWQAHFEKVLLGLDEDLRGKMVNGLRTGNSLFIQQAQDLVRDSMLGALWDLGRTEGPDALAREINRLARRHGGSVIGVNIGLGLRGGQ